MMVIIPTQLMHPFLKGSSKVQATIYSENHIEFKSERLKIIVERGISIPYSLQKDFDNKWVVFPEDSQYVEAFVKAYFPYTLKSQGYKLESFQEEMVVK